MDEQELQEMMRKLQETGDATSDFGDKVKDAGKNVYEFSKKSMTDLTKSVGAFSASAINGTKGFDTLVPVVDALGGAMAGLAGAIPLVGGAAKGLVQGVTGASKFLLTQLERQRKTFNDVSASGLILDGNLTQFSNTAFNSLMNLEQFGKIVADNGQALARMRGTAAQGTQAFGQLTQSITNDQTLRRLGYSAEELGDITGGFIKQQTRLGMSQTMTAEQLRLSTIDYVEELDTLSRLTGQNRKDLQAQQDALQREARFGTMLQRMNSANQQEAAKAMQDMVVGVAGFSPRMAEGLKDIMTAGTATTEEGRQLMMLSGGAIQGIIRDLKSGNIDYQTATQRLQRSLASAEQRYGQQAQILGDANPMLSDFANIAAFAKAELGDFAEAQKQTADQQSSVDKLITDMTSASTKIDEFAASLNRTILEALPLTATITEFMTGQLANMAAWVEGQIKQISEYLKESWDPNKGIMENTNSILRDILAEIRSYLGTAIENKLKDATGQEDIMNRLGDTGAGLGLGALGGAGLLALLGGPLGWAALLASMGIGGAVGYNWNDINPTDMDKVNAIPGTGEFPEDNARALGGPTRKGMPYLVGERGPELFIPRTSGSVIPNFGGEGRIGLEDIAGPKRSMLSMIESKFDSISATVSEPVASTQSTTNNRDEEMRLLALQSQKLDELIRLTSRQLNVSTATKKALS